MKKTIWFMHGFSNLYQAFLDIKKDDINNIFNILCSHKNPNFIGFDSADFREIEPIEPDDFLLFCEKIIQKYTITTVFATHRLALLGAHLDMFKAHGIELITCATPEYINIINDKAALYQLLDSQSVVNIPHYAQFSNAESFDIAYKMLAHNHSELCLKPTQGIYGEGFYRLQTTQKQLELSHNNACLEHDLKSLLSRSTTISLARFKSYLPKSNVPPMMLMQFLEGHERSVDCIAFQGKLVAGIIRKKPLFGGRQSIEYNENIMQQVTYLTEKLNLHGMFNIQFKDSKKNVNLSTKQHDLETPENNQSELIHYLLEINPRLSGGSYYATLAGLNIPYLAACIFSGVEISMPAQLGIDPIKYNSEVYSIDSPMIKYPLNSKG